jgi:hypothetical protein
MSMFRMFSVNQIMIESTENAEGRMGRNYFCATVMNAGAMSNKFSFFNTCVTAE